jgi:hypothetical protein
MDSQVNRLIGFAALGTAGAIHVGIVGINKAAFLAAKNPVFTRAKTETLHHATFGDCTSPTLDAH